MARHWTHTQCFAFFDTKPKNTRWSWSGKSEDGKIVSVTLWQDRFLEGGRIYKNHQLPPSENRPGFNELIENLLHAYTNLDGVVRVIIAKPKNPNERPRTIGECYPQPALRMRVTAIDPPAGTFTLERIETR